MTPRFVCAALLLLLAHKLSGGTYQRTKDGKTLVWNNYPNPTDQATWSGKRDSDGYAIGIGTLTWYTAGQGFQTGSLLPGKGHALVVTKFTGNMVHGKFSGRVVNVDSEGKKQQVKFVNGSRAGNHIATATASSNQRDDERLYAEDAPEPAPSPPPKKKPVVDAPKKPSVERAPAAPAEGPSPPEETRSPSAQVAIVTQISPQARLSSTPSHSSPPPSEDIEAEVRERIIADFKEETRMVLAQVDGATGSFRGVDQLDSVQKLPAPVEESVGSLVDRARAFRAQVGYETALRECRIETETVDALSTFDQVTRSIASNDAVDAGAKVTDFLNNNPEPKADSEKGLWNYLVSMRQLCGRLESDATIHLHRAQSLDAAGRTAEAIREYQEAYRIFPSPATAEKIRQLQNNTLGL